MPQKHLPTSNIDLRTAPANIAEPAEALEVNGLLSLISSRNMGDDLC